MSRKFTGLWKQWNGMFRGLEKGFGNYELEELRSYECWSLLTPELLDSKSINAAFCG